MPDYDLLRVEANPAKTWQELTEQQQLGLEKLLKMLEQAVNRSKGMKHLRHSNKLPWLNYDKCSQLAFIDGKRGTGKSTLMATLVSLLSGDVFSDLSETIATGNKNKEEVCKLAKSLAKSIIILEPLDMEPLPAGTPILAAILARLERSVQHYCGDSRSRGLLDSDLDDNREVIRFQQFKAKIARALDSNLAARKSSLDREQYGQAVIEQEDDRLELIANLTEVLTHLSKAIGNFAKQGGSSSDEPNHLFLVPVDDVDLNPERCLELLRLLRTYSPPQMFFLLMGQFDLVESIVKQSILHEYAGGGNPQMLKQSNPNLCRELTEIASANLQKMIPVRVILQSLSRKAILDFHPLNAEESCLTLGELFKQITFGNATTLGLPIEVKNLLDLLKYRDAGGSENDNALTRLGDYPGLHAFEVSPRRLVDLWNQLHQRLTAGPKHLDEDVLGIFQRHWERVTDEDPYIDSESRERLRDGGVSSCEFIADPDRVFCWARSIPKGEVRVQQKNQEEVAYLPTLRFIDDGPGTGIPFLAVKGRFIADSDGPKPVMIQSHRTRSAYVLLHDLTSFVHSSPRIKAPAVAEMLWEGEGAGAVPWPMPSLATFVELAQLHRKLRNCFYQRDISGSTLTIEQVEQMVGDWIGIGCDALGMRSPNDPSQSDKTWKALVTMLNNALNSNPNSPVKEWILQCALFSMPECCAIELGTRKRNSELPQSTIEFEALVQYFEKSKRELENRRTTQLAPLAELLNGRFHNELIGRTTDSSWLPIRARKIETKQSAVGR